ncbi:MAG: POT family proton-dependent oligopeptide transporter, partial [Candidatus Azotimanducaceae bacterium]
TTGELCLSPVGLSMVTKLSVQRVAAMMMGVWFLSSAFASYAAGLIAGGMAIDDSASDPVDAFTSLLTYSTVFEKLAIVALVLGVLMLLISPLLHKRMHGVH